MLAGRACEKSSDGGMKKPTSAMGTLLVSKNWSGPMVASG